MDLTFGLDAFTVDPVKDLLAATAALSSILLNFSTLPFVFQTGKFLSYLGRISTGPIDYSDVK